MSALLFYIKNYLWCTTVFTIGGAFAIYDLEPSLCWFGAFLCFIGIVIIPISSYISWSKKNFRE